MKNQKFLITGATGITGRKVVEILTSKGHDVRALVHKQDSRSQELQKLGAEIVVADLLNLDAVSTALKDVSAAYFVYPIAPGLIEATAVFAQAALEAGTSYVVNMSQISARREARSHSAQNHWLAERILDRSGISVTHLRPTFFAEWLLYPGQIEEINAGNIRMGFSDTAKHAPIAGEDQSRFIAALLEDPTGHAGKTYPLFGAKEYTHQELFSELSKILGRKIEYNKISYEEVLSKFSTWHSPFLGQHILEVTRDYNEGIFSGTDHIIERVTGQQPMGLEEFVQKNRDHFALQ